MAQDNPLVERLIAQAGRSNVITGGRQTRRFRKGYRFGEGRVLAVVRPRSLVDMWRTLEVAVAHGAIVIVQASNTGLTGGSTPDGDNYDREIVLINTMHLRGVRLIRDGRQVVCLPGATLDRLEKTLRPLGREPHSVIGSSCIGASVHGGVCNNSGGALLRRGPAYTQYALYAQVDAQRRLHLVNHLGIALDGSPEAVLQRLESGVYTEADIQDDPVRVASDQGYAQRVRETEADSPARFNADPGRLFEASGCAGKLAVFAVRLDTFASEEASVFYIGVNRPSTLDRVRRDLLGSTLDLPIAAEYIHREAFDIGDRYGKDVFLLIDRFGTERVPAAFALKSRVDGWCERLGLRSFTDRLLQRVVSRLPDHLPPRIREWRARYEHHLLLKVPRADAARFAERLAVILGAAEGAMFECTATEARKAFLHRFAIAGAAIRYRDTHRDTVEDIVSLDVALRRNDRHWMETLPVEIARDITVKLYYGHFFCHVFHQDYIVRKGADPQALEHRMLEVLAVRGAEYPAEHNVGHLYPAKPALAEFYRELDPSNTFNPGIGKTSRAAGWQSR